MHACKHACMLACMHVCTHVDTHTCTEHWRYQGCHSGSSAGVAWHPVSHPSQGCHSQSCAVVAFYPAVSHPLPWKLLRAHTRRLIRKWHYRAQHLITHFEIDFCFLCHQELPLCQLRHQLVYADAAAAAAAAAVGLGAHADLTLLAPVV